MISWFMGSSTTDSVEPIWDSLFPSLSVPPLLPLCLSLKINKLKKNDCIKVVTGLHNHLRGQLSIISIKCAHPTLNHFNSGLKVESIKEAP